MDNILKLRKNTYLQHTGLIKGGFKNKKSYKPQGATQVKVAVWVNKLNRQVSRVNFISGPVTSQITSGRVFHNGCQHDTPRCS